MADKTSLPVIPSTRRDDLHHLEWIEKSQLNLFMAGKQKRTVDVGPVWATEAVYARSRNLPVIAIDPGPDLDQRLKINYYICRLEQSPHTENAKKFLAFMASPQAHAIYEKCGFIAPVQ